MSLIGNKQGVISWLTHHFYCFTVVEKNLKERVEKVLWFEWSRDILSNF